MTNLLVFELVNSLKPEEVGRFRRFLQSDYFGEGLNMEDLTALFESIYSLIQEKRIETIDKAALYALIFPGKPVVRNKLEKLASDLNKMFKVYFLTQQYFAPENETQQQLDWLKTLRKRGMPHRYQQAVDKIRRGTDKRSIESLSYFQDQLLLVQEEHEWQSQYKNKGDLRLPELIEGLDDYYYIYRTELLNRLLVQHKHTVLDQTILEHLQHQWLVPEPKKVRSHFLQITWDIYALLKDENPSVFALQQLQQKIIDTEEKLNPEDTKAFYTYLRNLCNIFIDLGHIEFFPVLHEIQKDNLSRGYYYFDGKILPNACLNITQNAIKVGAIDWAKQFVEAHKDLISGDNEAGEYYRLNLSLCLFADKRYEEALDLIYFDAEFSFYHLMARRLELKIYYEMRSELLPFKIDAFSMFIRRTGQKVFSKDQYELNINFVNFMRQLSLSPIIPDAARSQRLIQRINAKKMVAERRWLLEKAAEIAGRR